MCGRNFNAPKMTDSAYMAFLFNSLHFCPECAIKIFEQTEKFRNMDTEEKIKYAEDKKRLLKTKYY